MFFALPFKDEPRPRYRPWVVYGLIALNVVIYFGATLPLQSVAAPADDPRLSEYLLATRGGLMGYRPSLFDLLAWDWGFRATAPLSLTVLSYMFLHHNFMHLFGNMLFLWIAGHNAERELGWWRFALAYLLTGVVAAFVYGFFSGGSEIPMIGASGAVFGVLGAYFLWFPAHRVLLLVVVLWFIRVIRVPARWVLGVYVVVADLLPFLVGERTQVAHSAHIGGFLAGLGIGFLAVRLGWAEREPVSGRGWRSQDSSTDLVEAFHQAVAGGQWQRALQIYGAMSPLQVQSADARSMLAVAQWLGASGQPQAALSILRRFIVGRPTSPWLAQAHLAAGILHLRGLHQLAPAYQHTLMVLDLDHTPQEAATARAVLREIELARAATRRSAYD